ncbi:Ankyrin repeat protein [Ilyonectria robusta]
MSPILCCGLWRRNHDGNGAQQAKDPTGSGVGLSTIKGQVPPQATLLVAPTAPPATPPVSSNQADTSGISPAHVPPHRQEEEAVCDDQKPPKPHANDYDLWNEALESLEESDRLKVGTFAGKSDSAQRQDSVANIQQKIAEALKVPQHDSTARRIIDNSVSVLSKFASVGDVAVSIDPLHAAPPWAVIRSLITILIAHKELWDQLVTGFAMVASILVQCDTYQQLYMAPELALRPQHGPLDRLKESIVQAYTKAQLFLSFAIKCKESKTKGATAVFKLEPMKHCVDGLLEGENQLLRAGDDCGRYCELSSRANIEELLKLAAEFHGFIQDQVASILTRMDEKDHIEILEWISRAPYGKHHETVKSARTDGTGEWLLSHMKFREWESKDSSAILWLQGSAGTGKTFLTSRVIGRIEGLAHDQEGVSYFYCNRNEEERRQPLSIFQSYVRQLAAPQGRPAHMRTQLKKLCLETRQKGSVLNFGACEDELLESINGYSKTTLILDALDECEQESRWDLVSAMERLMSRAKKPLKIFIASRPDAETRDLFISQPNIEIQARDNQADIEKFVIEEINKGGRQRRISPRLREKIVNVILESSHGIQVLKLRTEADIESRLGKLPVGLKKTYDEIYARNAEHQHAKIFLDRACMWVMSACTPLSSSELLSAIQVDPRLDTIDLPTDFTESELLDVCENLLVLDSQRLVWRFSHLSVREYFEGNHFDFWQAHCNAAKVCLKLLINTHESLPDESEAETSDSAHNVEPQDMFNPLQRYLLHHWVIHVRTYDEQMVKEGQEADLNLKCLLKTFLGSPGESSTQYRHWYRQICQADRQRPSSSIMTYMVIEDIFPADVTLFAMCRFSFYAVLRDWWDDAEMAVSQVNSQGHNLLTLAVLGRCKPICEVLLKQGIQINLLLSSGRFGSALAAAACEGNIETVQFLVDNGAEVNLRLSSGRFGSALAAAAYEGNIETVQFLVDNGAEVNLRLSSGRFGSALAAAAYRGYIETVQFLVDKGAEVNLLLSSGSYGSALAAAANGGEIETVKFLVDKGAKVNLLLSSGSCGSALAAAASGGYIETVKFLFDKGAEVNLRLLTGFYSSALKAANSSGNSAVVEFLTKIGTRESQGRVEESQAHVLRCVKFDIARNLWSWIQSEGPDSDLVIVCLFSPILDIPKMKRKESTRKPRDTHGFFECSFADLLVLPNGHRIDK